jgi:hypothetical protein
VSSAAESVLERSPDETFWVEVVGKLVAEFLRLQEQCSRLERPDMRIYDLLLGFLLCQAQWANRLTEAAGWEVSTELEALWTSAM